MNQKLRRSRVAEGMPADRSILFLFVVTLIVVVGYDVLLAGSQEPYLFGLIGDDKAHLREEQDAGVGAKVFRLSWREYYPREGEKDYAYLQRKKEEIEQLREAGFEIILSLGFHDTPPWVHENYEDTYYINQLGERYTGDTFANGTPIDNGDANLVFNEELRSLVESYMEDVFSECGTNFYAVRLGGGRYGELTYPPADYEDQSNLYWAYDKNAQNSASGAAVSGWRPGNPSVNAEAKRFLNWYLSALVDYQNWQVRSLRNADYAGRAMMLYPSWGIRPGQVKEAVVTNLDGSTPAERNGEIQRGLAFAQQVRSITDERVVITTTWLDADASGDADENRRYWSPVKYLADLADEHPSSIELYGENTGEGDRAAMELSASQMRRYGLTGMAWYREEELFSGRYANLQDYEWIIKTSQEAGS
jgi:hypothetical protein